MTALPPECRNRVSPIVTLSAWPPGIPMSKCEGLGTLQAAGVWTCGTKAWCLLPAWSSYPPLLPCPPEANYE